MFDEKDRRILLGLDKDSRQTDSQIAKDVHVSKQVANYRVQSLIKKGIIEGFYTVLNTGRLGLDSYYVFLQLEKINKEQEKELLNKLNNLNYVGWLVSCIGRWDVVLMVYAGSISTFDLLLNQIMQICDEHLHEYNFTTMITAEHVGYKFLGEKRQFKSAKQTEKKGVLVLDERDKKVLSILSQDARLPAVDISRKTKIPVHVVSYRIKSLVKENLIVGFKPKINIGKLGYQWHLVLLQFRNINQDRKKEFIEFCRQHNKVYYVTNTVGYYNLMLDLHVKSSEEFRDFLLDLKDKFPDVIRLYESVVVFDEYKISYFPKDLL